MMPIYINGFRFYPSNHLCVFKGPTTERLIFCCCCLFCCCFCLWKGSQTHRQKKNWFPINAICWENKWIFWWHVTISLLYVCISIYIILLLLPSLTQCLRLFQNFIHIYIFIFLLFCNACVFVCMSVGNNL